MRLGTNCFAITLCLDWRSGGSYERRVPLEEDARDVPSDSLWKTYSAAVNTFPLRLVKTRGRPKGECGVLASR
jgi:hypothetical protein